MRGDKQARELEAVPLSDGTISRRITDMAQDIKCQLTDRVKKGKYALQLDESTDTSNSARLLVFARYSFDGKLAEDMLYAYYDPRGEILAGPSTVHELLQRLPLPVLRLWFVLSTKHCEPKAKKKNQVPKEESRMESIKEDLDGSISRLEFLEAEIEWQDNMIKDLQKRLSWASSLKAPAEVVHRYKKVLKTSGRVRTMSEAFRVTNVDRGTITMTAPIAELKIVDPDTSETLKFDPAIDTLLSFAKKCAADATVDKKAQIEDMKPKARFLPG
ncbi:hypothetical protein KUCAC02_021953 [Chaenocephalus aceratus]|nr:hypothetical protein KUCAC02_021953 [Chaenocephalus aceratus]